VFGHAALLTDAPFADFLEELGKLGARNKSDERKMKYLASIYWYTAEVGLIMENGTLKYYGGSIISSASEIETVYKDDSIKKIYSAAMAGQTPYDSYTVNSNYFIIDKLTDLNDSLEEIRLYTENGFPVTDERLSGIVTAQ
jgi:phenylalanine-4-hydroxylase